MDIETPRLVIRDFVPDDLADLQEILGDAQTMRYAEPAYPPEKTAAFLRDFCIGQKAALAAVHRPSGKVIGYILFHEGPKDVYEMGWFFNRAYWRHGYAFEAARAVLEVAFERLGAHKVFAETIDDTRAVGLMKKLGMQPEGCQRAQCRDLAENWADLYLYGILEPSKNA